MNSLNMIIKRRIVMNLPITLSHQAMRRLTGRAIASILLVACASLFSACKEAQTVAPAANEIEANEMITVLKDNNIEAHKIEVGENDVKQLKVVIDEGWFNKGDTAAAIQVLQEHGLPHPADKGLEEADDEKGPFASEAAQEAKRLRAQKTEAERQVRTLPGVIRVYARISPAQDNTTLLNPSPARASVSIVYKEPKPAFNISDVQAMIAGGIRDLKPENVNVTLVPEASRPSPRRELDARHRTSLIYAIGIGVMTILAALSIVLLLQMRRDRAELATLREAASDQQLLEEGDEAEDGSVPKARWLNEENSADASSDDHRLTDADTGASRQLSASSTTENETTRASSMIE